MALNGASGPNSETINGIYVKYEAAVNGQPVYTKLSDDAVWLVFTSQRHWIVTDNADAKKGITCAGYATTEIGLASPFAAKKWKVAVKSGWDDQCGIVARFLVSDFVVYATCTKYI